MKTSVFERFPQLKKISSDKFPNHVLIIPDGNGRWAEIKGKSTIVGHKNGYEVLKEVLKNLQELPISIVTIWGFASDNWKRSKKEVKGLMKLFEQGLEDALPDLIKNKSRLIHLGRKDRIPKSLKKTIEETEGFTRENKEKTICIAIDYGGEDQELRIMQKIQELPLNTTIDFDLLKKLRDGNGEIPPADFIIRTSGEQRTSDLGWLSQNAEFYSISKFLPDATMEDFVKALINYSKRERRFGARPRQTRLN